MGIAVNFLGAGGIPLSLRPPVFPAAPNLDDLQRVNFPDLGVGVGLRTVHYGHLLSQEPQVERQDRVDQAVCRFVSRPSSFFSLRE